MLIVVHASFFKLIFPCKRLSLAFLRFKIFKIVFFLARFNVFSINSVRFETNFKSEILTHSCSFVLFDRDEPTSSTTVYYSPFYSAHAEKPDTNLGEEREKSPKIEKLFLIFCSRINSLPYKIYINSEY